MSRIPLDGCPKETYLVRMVVYFMETEVQTRFSISDGKRQVFKNADAFQKNSQSRQIIGGKPHYA